MKDDSRVEKLVDRWVEGKDFSLVDWWGGWWDE